MALNTSPLMIALVGIGPRSLGALEALTVATTKSDMPIEVHIFDPTMCPGAGPNFDPSQSDICLLNVPMRDISIAAPDELKTDAFGTFEKSTPSDAFPARSTLGSYLGERLRALDKTKLTLRHHKRAVDGAEHTDKGWILSVSDENVGPFQEVTLSQGQPATIPDKQLEQWQSQAQKHQLDLQSAYPPNQLIEAARSWRGKTVGVRGLGLSTFDVVRLLTLGMGSVFTQRKCTCSMIRPKKRTGTARHSVKGGRRGRAMCQSLRARNRVTPHHKKPNLRNPGGAWEGR